MHSQHAYFVESDDFHDILEDDDLFECFLSLPTLATPSHNPLNYKYIRDEQQTCAAIATARQKHPNNYVTKELDDNVHVICHVKTGKDPNVDWKIALPESMLDETISWFHTVLCHPGQKRLNEMMQTRYYHPDLRRHINNLRCDVCSRNKLSGPGYGLLPEREVRGQPFEEIAVDLIGPWTLRVSGRNYEFYALTIIDTVTNLVELIRLDNCTGEHTLMKFQHAWLARYPWPQRVIHDPGSQFIAEVFKDLLERLSITSAEGTTKNAQSNAVCERMHQTVGNVLRTYINFDQAPTNLSEARDIIDDCLATAMHAMRTNIATSLGSSPGALVYGRDMFLNVPLIADWHSIATRREQLVNENLRRQNLKRRTYDYNVNDLVLKKVYKPTKLGQRTTGPYTITRVYANGNVTIQLSPTVTERINIRRIQPYRG